MEVARGRNSSKNGLTRVLAGLRSSGSKALIGFICVGDPDVSVTEAAVLEMEKQGVDAIELGIPFSDPLADGPVIQAAYTRALRRGITMSHVMALVTRLRARTGVPLILLTYFNPIIRRGIDEFVREAAEAGVDGLIVPDMPIEEAGELVRYVRSSGLAFIPMVAPTTTSKRVRRIAGVADAFIYLVTVTGVTGKRAGIPTEVPEAARRIRRETDIPIVAGFGISTAAQAASLKPHVDGVVVGSALVEALSGPGGVEEVSRIISRVRESL